MSRSKARSAARLAAVQALFQLESEKITLPCLLHEFHEHRLGATIDDDIYIDAEVTFFDDLVSGVAARLTEIDALVEARLATGWTLVRLDRAMRQILRAGTYELLARKDLPAKVIINEYVDVADAFFDKPEKGFVNGVLDSLSTAIRG